MTVRRSVAGASLFGNSMLWWWNHYGWMLALLVFLTWHFTTLAQFFFNQPQQPLRSVNDGMTPTAARTMFVWQPQEALPPQQHHGTWNFSLYPPYRVKRKVSSRRFPITFYEHHAARLLDQYQPFLPRLWNCTSLSPSSSAMGKLIFVHVFKTAGTAFRQFLDGYAHACHRSIAILNKCSDVSAASLWVNATANTSTTTSNIIWYNRPSSSSSSGKSLRKQHHQRPCYLSWFRNRQGQAAPAPHRMVMSSSYLDRDADILAGHLPLGVYRPYPLPTTNNIGDGSDGGASGRAYHGHIYLIFVRDPMHKYVSAQLYLNQFRHNDWTVQDAALYIQQKIINTQQSNDSYYQKYATYLLTPQQKELAADPDHVVRMVMENFIHLPILIGVIELMNDSLHLISYVMDGAEELNEFFHDLDDTTNTQEGHRNFPNQTAETHTSTRTQKRTNQSRLSSSAVLTELLRNETFACQFRHYLRYEYQIYQFAVQVHQRQVQSLRHSPPKSSFHSNSNIRQGR